jgi:hypothetical protein
VAMTVIAGMTVNERLFHMGLLSVWDHAIELDDKGKLREILKQIGLADQADSIIHTALNQHRKMLFLRETQKSSQN